jgi:hypothetical protein
VSALEARYRAALRWYPRAWRAENADAIVGTMLDQAQAEGRSAPAPGELRNLAASGLSHNIEQFAPHAVRDRVALIALALGAAASLLSFVLTEWAPLAPRDIVHFSDGGFYVPPELQFGPFLSGAVVLYAAWLLALLAIIARQRLISVVLLALTLPYSVVLYASRPEAWAQHQPQAGAMVILGGLALLVIVGDARSPLPLSRLGVALIGGLAIALLGLLTGGVYFFFGRVFGGAVFTFFEPRSVLAALLVLAVYSAVRRRASWTAALVLSALPWLVLSALYLVPVAVVAAGAGALFTLVIAFGVWRVVRAQTTTIA